MTDDDALPLESANRFEWDAQKNDANRIKHGIDFDEAIDVFSGDHQLVRSDRNKEKRWIAIGESQGRLIAVVFTRRGGAVRIISARSARKMKSERIVTRKFGDRRKGKTDWEKVDKLTDAEITAAMADDPDWKDNMDIDWSKAVLVIPPEKTAISIRVDNDVLDFFKKEGAGYQRRINAVLRSYMDQKKPRKRA